MWHSGGNAGVPRVVVDRLGDVGMVELCNGSTKQLLDGVMCTCEAVIKMILRFIQAILDWLQVTQGVGELGLQGG